MTEAYVSEYVSQLLLANTLWYMSDSNIDKKTQYCNIRQHSIAGIGGHLGWTPPLWSILDPRSHFPEKGRITIAPSLGLKILWKYVVIRVVLSPIKKKLLPPGPKNKIWALVLALGGDVTFWSAPKSRPLSPAGSVNHLTRDQPSGKESQFTGRRTEQMEE